MNPIPIIMKFPVSFILLVLGVLALLFGFNIVAYLGIMMDNTVIAVALFIASAVVFRYFKM